MITATDRKKLVADSSPAMRIPDNLPDNILDAALAYAAVVPVTCWWPGRRSLITPKTSRST